MAWRGAFYTQLWFLVLVATAIGIGLGWRAPQLGAQMKPLGDGFIALVRMMIAAVNLSKPGVGMNIDPHRLDTHLVSGYAAQARTVPQYLQGIIPESFFAAFTQGAVLPVLFVSVLFAFALASLGEKGRPLVELIG